MDDADRHQKARATRAANRAAGPPQPEYPWAPTAQSCHTCRGTGVLRARYGRIIRWTVCPPCRGRGQDRIAHDHWDAGPVAEWLDANDDQALDTIAGRVRQAAPPVGDNSTDTTVTRQERARRALSGEGGSGEPHAAIEHCGVRQEDS